jgi:hypothetical protein
MPTHTNPFPGINPYFQYRWSDVHGALIQFVREETSGELPDDLAANTEEAIAVQEQAGFSHNPQPPVAPEDADWVAERLDAAGLRQ